MNNRIVQTTPSWSKVISASALAGVAVSFMYAFCFVTYAILRSSFAVSTMIADGKFVTGTLLSNSATIALASFSTALALAPLTAGLGALTGCLVYVCYRWPQHPPTGRQALWLGAGVALIAAICCQLAIRLAVGPALMTLGWATYLFWLGLPALLHVVAGSAGVWYLGQRWHPAPLAHS